MAGESPQILCAYRSSFERVVVQLGVEQRADDRRVRRRRRPRPVAARLPASRSGDPVSDGTPVEPLQREPAVVGVQVVGGRQRVARLGERPARSTASCARPAQYSHAGR